MKKGFVVAMVLAAAAVGAWDQMPVVAVAPFEAKGGISAADADTITEIYSIRLSAARVVRVVTRDSLDKVIREHGFQAGDWSNDTKTAALGEALNADWIVRGTLQKLGANLIVTVTVLDIKSLQVMGGGDIRIAGIDDAYDNMSGLVSQTVQTLTGGSGRAAVNTGDKVVEEYKVGDFGPAGGWIFYDKGRVINGWRYMEAAPAEAEFTGIQWGAYQIKYNDFLGMNLAYGIIGGTATGVGMGKRNTELIVNYLKRTGESNRAAQLCDELVMDGWDDWFLPSKDELDLMYKNLKVKGLGEFRTAPYWSSSEEIDSSAWAIAWEQDFSDGRQISNFRNYTNRVRPVRAF
jgi:TolB-like protein